MNGYLRPSNQTWCRESFKNNTVISIQMYLEENAVKMRSFKSFSLRIRLRRFSDGINQLMLWKFRLSDDKLLIGIGRYLKIPRDQRLCAICNALEDEFHFFFECKRNTNNRNNLYQYFQIIYSNFLELNHEEKLTKILNPSTPEQILWNHKDSH